MHEPQKLKTSENYAKKLQDTYLQLCIGGEGIGRIGSIAWQRLLGTIMAFSAQHCCLLFKDVRRAYKKYSTVKGEC